MTTAPNNALMDHTFSAQQLEALKLTSLIIASLSVGTTVLTTYWFLRMTRSFRHDLIILLIQSDMLKALCFVILPAVELARGPVASDSAICQASGFFLAIGIEACDVAVALVAIHTALFIFRGANGLYAYRRFAYAAFVMLPLVLASMAFIQRPAFINTGQYCYLPRHPQWPRRALSWIPRYIIMATICVTYVFTYTYVKILISRFDDAGTWRGNGSTPARSRRPRFENCRPRGTASVPPTPRISYHGLIPPTPPRETASLKRKEPKFSSSTAARSSSSQCDGMGPLDEALDPLTGRKTLLAPVPENPIKWKIPQFRSHDSPQRAMSDGNIAPVLLSTSRHSAVTEGHTSRMHSGASKVHLSVSTSRAPSSSSQPVSASSTTKVHDPHDTTTSHFWNRSLAVTAPSASHRVPSEPNLVAMLRRGPGDSDSSGSVVLSPTTLEFTGMGKTRVRIRRQLRQLFVYPAVYIFVWLMPFVSHIIRNDTSFVLVLASLVSLSMQGIADALVFSMMEKPWQHRPRKNEVVTGWCTGRLWPGRGAGESGVVGSAAKVGKTREEMLVEGRMARRRREVELADWKLKRPGPVHQPRDWWDVHLDSLDESNEDDSVGRMTV